MAATYLSNTPLQWHDPQRRTHLPTRRQRMYIALALVLILLLAACDRPSSSAASAPSPTPSPMSSPSATPKPKPLPTPTLETSTSIPPPPSATAGRARDLQIEGGMGCALFGIGSANVVVADPSRNNYATGDLQAIRNYFNPTSSDYIDPASATGGILTYAGGGPTCSGQFTVTNIGPSPLIFAQMALHLEHRPQINAYHYVLVDECPFFSPGDTCPHGAGGGPPGCSDYSAAFTLDGSGTAGTRLRQPLQPPSGEGCPSELTINPQETVTLYLSVSSARAYIYRVQVELMQDIGGGQLVPYPLDSVQTALVTAQRSQFSCVDISSGMPQPVVLRDENGVACE